MGKELEEITGPPSWVSSISDLFFPSFVNVCESACAWRVPCIWLSFSRRATGFRQAPATRLHPSLLIWLGHWLAVSVIAFACCCVFKNSLDPSSPPLLISQLPQGVLGITSRHDNHTLPLTDFALFILFFFFIALKVSFFSLLLRWLFLSVVQCGLPVATAVHTTSTKWTRVHLKGRAEMNEYRTALF